ncbi:hypothetical protein [Cryobacterium psychrophilum]|uniref:NTP pyrophosphohydrolase n=1 Tax=Cryobacterium psychrophilum TaxID=41988 RepID=A0A4Y8KUH8_9MICO|nr:hypothetical protein [Cryobacterium psychrophilum]TDW29630.1 hypothetical protein EDD25_1340 [Cryobacterium psychrophilum]TFD81752.1 hypothetical protein E3T53_01775 [Cryobacterium psychrophilum]
MDTQTVARHGGAPPPRATIGVTLRPGRTVVHDRVIQKVVEEVSAAALGVDRSKVTVRISPASGGIAVTVASPLPIPPLDDATAVRATGSVLDRLSATQASLRQQIERITGRDVTRVNITVTGAIVSEQRRVK